MQRQATPRRASGIGVLWKMGRTKPRILPLKGVNPLAATTSLGAEHRVSVIIPYYNQPAFLAEAVSSVERQTYSNVEIIVVDDGSAVPAESVLSQPSNILILRTENRGVSAARNLGFERCSGDFLIFLDSDDRLCPGAVAAHLQDLCERPDAGLSFGSTRIIDQSGAEIRPPHICRPRKDYFRMLLEGNPIGSPGAAMIRRAAFVAAGRFNESVSMGEDYDLYLRIARERPLVQHNTCVLEYREHGANTSRAQEQMLLSTMVVLDLIEPRLSDSERRRLPHARRRWKHVFRRKTTLAYKLMDLYFRFRAMWGVPFSNYFSRNVDHARVWRFNHAGEQ
jgi:glycosyltransferase involved in cell wall biosynthesis